MVIGWRRAFCTSVRRERETTTTEKQQQEKSNNNTNNNNQNSPRLSSKFGFFSNSSTPRLLHTNSQPQLPVSSSSLKTIKTSSVPNSPKLHCKTNNSPRFFNFSSNPSSPKSSSTSSSSPSSFSFLKSTLGLSKSSSSSSRCGICLQNVKTGQGTAIFTAECSHSFHFPCIASHIKKHNLLTCPLCSSTWKQAPLLFLQEPNNKENQNQSLPNKNLRVYNDDEPLISKVSHFNPILESEEEETQQDKKTQFAVSNSNVKVTLLPETAVVTIGKSYETYALVLKVKAPSFTTARGLRRAPIDLVTVLDVGLSMNGVKLQMMKRAMRLVISSLSSSDRLSIVIFSATSKRLLPLKRMTSNGKRSARRIVDALGTTGQGMSANDALKKAAKVLEDRRERNPIATIIILSESDNHSQSSPITVSSTRLTKSDIPVHSIGFKNAGACNHAPMKCVSGLLSVMVQDLKLQLGSVSSEIAAVYSLTGKPVYLGSGLIRVGDLYAEEERDLLIELKVAASSVGAHHVLSVRSSYKDPSSQEQVSSKEQLLLISKPQAVRSSSPSIGRLRNLHVSTRAIAESKRLIEINNDLSGAYHLLSSAKALLIQRNSNGSADEYLRGLDVELAELHRRRQQQVAAQQSQTPRLRVAQVEDKPEPLTPTSAWRAAERLAKVAIMRKHMNRVSDLHGFENARF